MSFPYEPGSNSYKLGETIGRKDIYIPSLFNTLTFRNPTMSVIPCKTIQDITFPPARISNIGEMAGYKAPMFGHGDKVPKEFSLFHDNQYKLNTPLLKPAPTFFV